MTRYLVPYHLDEHVPDLDVPVATDTTIRTELPAGDRNRPGGGRRVGLYLAAW